MLVDAMFITSNNDKLVDSIVYCGGVTKGDFVLRADKIA